jgi:hypothetical protein
MSPDHPLNPDHVRKGIWMLALDKTLLSHQRALLKALDHRTGRGEYVQVTIGEKAIPYSAYPREGVRFPWMTAQSRVD